MQLENQSSGLMTPFLDHMIQEPQHMSSPLFLGVMRFFPECISSRYDEWVSRAQATYRAPLLAGLGMVRKEPQRILDLCTGTGIAALQLAERFPEAEVIGLDHSPGMIEEAAHKAKFSNVPNVTFEQGDAQALCYDDASFDMVTVSNAPIYMEEAVRVLKPNGTMLAVFSMGGDAFLKNKADIRALVEENGLVLMAMRRVAKGVFIVAEKRP